MRLYQVDSFSSRPFAGNPAGVCPLDGPAPEEWMQRVAAEVNVAETAFTYPMADGSYWLQWFTPTTEVDLCGHATLATAHIMNTVDHYPGRTKSVIDGKIRFATNSGELTAEFEGDEVVLDFPATPVQECPAPDGISDALGGAEPVAVGESKFDLLVELASLEAVGAVMPDMGKLATLPYRGIIVTASGGPDKDVDFVSRFFAPAVGVPEDPVTGSAHCALAPYWHERIGGYALRGYQASRRGGYVGVRVRDDRVELRGNAVTVMTIELSDLAKPGA